MEYNGRMTKDPKAIATQVLEHLKENSDARLGDITAEQLTLLCKSLLSTKVTQETQVKLISSIWRGKWPKR